MGYCIYGFDGPEKDICGCETSTGARYCQYHQDIIDHDEREAHNRTVTNNLVGTKAFCDSQGHDQSSGLDGLCSECFTSVYQFNHSLQYS